MSSPIANSVDPTRSDTGVISLLGRPDSPYGPWRARSRTLFSPQRVRSPLRIATHRSDNARAATVWGAVVRAARKHLYTAWLSGSHVTGGFVAPGLTLRAYQHRRLLRVVVDCGVWFLALYGASLLRLDFDPARLDGFHIALLLPVAWTGQTALGYYYGLYRGRWINGSFDEVSALGRTAFATTAVLLAIDLLVPKTRPAPASAVIGAGLLAFLAMGGARYAARQMLENQRRQKPDARRKRAIIFGAGEGGDRTIRAMLYDEHSPYVPVALLDDDSEQAEPHGPGRQGDRRPQRPACGGRGVRGPGARDRGPDR